MTLLIENARILTLAGDPARRRGNGAGDLGVIERGWVRTEGDAISGVGEGAPPDGVPTQRIDAAGRVVCPGFVDCHTHMCWAGSRLAEWEASLAGASYLELLEAGGGIMSTVRSVRDASESTLADTLLARLHRALAEGTTAIEIKSGYGLATEHELKMLRAIHAAAADWPGCIAATACIGHALDPDVDRERFIRRTIDETLPAVSAEFPGVAIDAYCEEGAWSLEECVELFDRAMEAGHPVRVHADQFHSLGMVPEAVRRGFRSVDHLEATTEADLRLLAESDTFAVALPCSGFHVDGRYADGRALLDAGGRLAIATNANPGSAPCLAIPMAIALAVRHNGLMPAEALAGATAVAAELLGLPRLGRVETGCRADLLVLDCEDERSLAYDFGFRRVDQVVCAGVVRP